MKTETLKLGLFPKAYFFNMENKWIVIEKERDVVCIYATGENNTPIFAAIPMCHPKYFKKKVFEIKAANGNDSLVLISVADIRIVINYKDKFCAINNNARVFGSEHWGKDCSREWSAEFDGLF